MLNPITHCILCNSLLVKNSQNYFECLECDDNYHPSKFYIKVVNEKIVTYEFRILINITRYSIFSSESKSITIIYNGYDIIFKINKFLEFPINNSKEELEKTIMKFLKLKAFI